MRRVSHVLLSLGALIAAALLAVTAAADGTTASPVPRTSGGQPVDSAADARALARYWTKERMENAIPLDRAPGAGAAARKAAPTGRPGSIPPAVPESSGVRPLIPESAAVGKVFFTDPRDGLNYVCSAGAINSNSKQMLATAGHCVHGGSGGDWMTNWTYAPRYRNGVRPFGTYAAKQFRTFNAWINDSDFGRDAAFVTTWPLNGNKIVNVTGGHGLSWNYSREQAVTVVGYPGNLDAGQLQWYCQGTTKRVSVFDGRIEIQCDFGGGSSGGPWLRVFDEANQLGNINGVMSTLASGGWNRSPYFDDAVKTMYDNQGSVT